MGRERYWGGKSTTATTKRVEKETAPGCMSGMLHLFDFNPMTQHPCFKPNSIIVLEDLTPTPTKGTEAPRNSLELELGESTSTAAFSSEIKQEKFDIPNEIRLSTTKAKDYFSSASESTDSPAAKTPNLVARLMGLDLLPDSSVLSPSPASSDRFSNVKYQMKKRQRFLLDTEISGSRSLPDTPRISSARRSADVDPRLSLQINRENMVVSEEFEFLGRACRDQKSRRNELRDEEESRSPRDYARQIVKQVKETVSRRMGSDITNIVNNNASMIEIQPHAASIRYNSTRSRHKANQGEQLAFKKPNCLTKIEEESSSTKHTTQSQSPRLRLLQSKNKSVATRAPQVLPSRPPPPPPPSAFDIQVKPKLTKTVVKEQKIEKCKKGNCERFTQRKEGTPKTSFNDKKCMKTEQFVKESSLSSTPPQSQKQFTKQSRPSKPCSRLSSSSSRTPYDQQKRHQQLQEEQQPTPTLLHDRDNSNGTGCDIIATELQYIKEILSCTGIKANSLISFAKWFTPSHPLHPSTFLYLEQHGHATELLKHRWNRKLMFDLVDEILVDILRPYLNTKPWHARSGHKQTSGQDLVQLLWLQITSFPSAKCEVLEDIDNLVEKDLVKHSNMQMMLQESESIVGEIEHEILDTLIHETATSVLQSRLQLHAHTTRASTTTGTTTLTLHSSSVQYNGAIFGSDTYNVT